VLECLDSTVGTHGASTLSSHVPLATAGGACGVVVFPCSELFPGRFKIGLPIGDQCVYAGRTASAEVVPKGTLRTREVVRSAPVLRAADDSESYLVDPASSHMLVSKIKPCMSQCK
jgi:hypothetical protein